MPHSTPEPALSRKPDRGHFNFPHDSKRQPPTDEERSRGFTTAPPPTDQRAASVESAIRNLRASITILDDESFPVLDWEIRDELISNLREAIKELKQL